MKKVVLCIGVVLLSYSYSYSQTTTEDEYNYVTKGYQELVVKDGGDLKKGYTLKDFGSWGYAPGTTFGNDTAYVDFKGLYREGIAKPIAIMAIYKKGEDREYVCIPSKNASDVWELTLTKIQSYRMRNSEMYSAFTYALMKLASENMTAH